MYGKVPLLSDPVDRPEMDPNLIDPSKIFRSKARKKKFVGDGSNRSVFDHLEDKNTSRHHAKANSVFSQYRKPLGMLADANLSARASIEKIISPINSRRNLQHNSIGMGRNQDRVQHHKSQSLPHHPLK